MSRLRPGVASAWAGVQHTAQMPCRDDNVPVGGSAIWGQSWVVTDGDHAVGRITATVELKAQAIEHMFDNMSS